MLKTSRTNCCKGVCMEKDVGSFTLNFPQSDSSEQRKLGQKKEG